MRSLLRVTDFLFPGQASLVVMDSWPSPALPQLPGRGHQLRLFDTASASIVSVGPTTGSAPARLYVCGITPYDATHLGHGATYLAFDLAQRVWRDAGRAVNYVQNVTDVDDPLLERAARDGEDWRALAKRETRRFCDDMAAMRLLAPTSYVGVAESMADISEGIDKLRTVGAAYELADGTGDIYFDLASAREFGYESGYDAATMRALFAGRGGDPERAGKRNPLDPLLWRGARKGEPSWEAPFGAGRPGWHIECSVIAINYLGSEIDVQGGGSDLIFPHHEMSAAHAEVATGEHPFARAYVHTGVVGLRGEKMSKSQGNLVFSATLRAQGVDPAAIRLALITPHYRVDRDWLPSCLAEAQERLARWREAARLSASPDPRPLLATLRERLADDLDTPGAIAAVDDWAMAALANGSSSARADDSAAGLAAQAVDALLGIELAPSRP